MGGHWNNVSRRGGRPIALAVETVSQQQKAYKARYALEAKLNPIILTEQCEQLAREVYGPQATIELFRSGKARFHARWYARVWIKPAKFAGWEVSAIGVPDRRDVLTKLKDRLLALMEEPRAVSQQKAYYKARYARLVAAGSCRSCGAEAQKDRTRCRPCGRQNAAVTAARAARLRAAKSVREIPNK
jgi:hypothetical protein